LLPKKPVAAASNPERTDRTGGQGEEGMSKSNRITRATAPGRAAAFSLIALLAGAGRSPAPAQKLSGARLTADILASGSGLVVQGQPDTMVGSAQDLAQHLKDPQFAGRLIIPQDAVWDMGSYPDLPVRSGVSMIGARGALGKRPRLYTNVRNQDFVLFDITGNDVRVESLHLQGPAGGNRAANQRESKAIHILEDADHQLGRRIVITDNELDQWTVASVEAQGNHRDALLPSDYDPHWALTLPTDAGLVRIESNYIHDNAMDSEGYGVVLRGGAYVTIEGNVFDYNRHAVASDGHAHSGYIAQYNYVLEGGYEDNGSYEQHFDAHGAMASGSQHVGGAAGEYYKIAGNTIRGAQTYGSGSQSTRPAFDLRGRPAMSADFQDNLLVHGGIKAAIRLRNGADPSLDPNNDATFNLHAVNNQLSTDHSTEIAAGDFDGDGHTDVFVATGAAWFFSRGGAQPWTYLQPSVLLTSELAFADLDNDGTTDVLWRTPSGILEYWKGGRGSAVTLTPVPVTVDMLRFGDFDGDHQTDIFYTLNGGWHIWYSHNHVWGSGAGSSLPLAELLFADFDQDGRTSPGRSVASGTIRAAPASTGRR
jgi:hypothetical protein